MSKETAPEKYNDLWVSREQNANAPGNPGKDSKNVGGYEAFDERDFLSEDFSPFNLKVPADTCTESHIRIRNGA